uniref:Uncharacterized protein n=2 Tax=Octopus bimaculoides TaxID=37653 RepID=A0A0L8FK86_OCTBM
MRTQVRNFPKTPDEGWRTGELIRAMEGNIVGASNLHLACNGQLLVGSAHTDNLDVNELSTKKGVTNRNLQIWDFKTGSPLVMADQEYCSALQVLSDGDKVALGRTDKYGNSTSIIVWDLLGNQPIKEMRYEASVGNNDYISFLCLSQNNRYAVAGFNNTFDNSAEFVIFDMTLTSYNVVEPSILKMDANPECTAVLPQDEAVTGLRNGDLVIWNLRNGQPSRQLLSSSGLHAHTSEVSAIALSEDSSVLVSASADGTVKVWDMKNEVLGSTLIGHTREVSCVAISSDNEMIASGSQDGTIRLWRTQTGSQICAFNTNMDVFFVTMSKDNSTIVALGDKFGARKLIMLQVVRSKVRKHVLA